MLARFVIVVFLDLDGVCKEVVIAIVSAGVVAFAGVVFATDHRSGLVDLAHAVDSKILAPCLELDIPFPLFDEYQNAFVHEVPSHVVVVLGCFGAV